MGHSVPHSNVCMCKQSSALIFTSVARLEPSSHVRLSAWNSRGTTQWETGAPDEFLCPIHTVLVPTPSYPSICHLDLEQNFTWEKANRTGMGGTIFRQEHLSWYLTAFQTQYTVAIIMYPCKNTLCILVCGVSSLVLLHLNIGNIQHQSVCSR